jgi:hypothetical protein
MYQDHRYKIHSRIWTERPLTAEHKVKIRCVNDEFVAVLN